MVLHGGEPCVVHRGDTPDQQALLRVYNLAVPLADAPAAGARCPNCSTPGGGRCDCGCWSAVDEKTHAAQPQGCFDNINLRLNAAAAKLQQQVCNGLLVSYSMATHNPIPSPGWVPLQAQFETVFLHLPSAPLWQHVALLEELGISHLASAHFQHVPSRCPVGAAMAQQSTPATISECFYGVLGCVSMVAGVIGRVGLEMPDNVEQAVGACWMVLCRCIVVVNSVDYIVNVKTTLGCP